jgi:hypothetical protein
MMSRREALLLVDRLKRRTRDPEVLTLCDYVNGMEVHGTIPAFRQPGDGTPPAVFPTASCPVCAARRAAETARKKRWRHGRQDSRLMGFWGRWRWLRSSFARHWGRWGTLAPIRVYGVTRRVGGCSSWS